MGNVITTDIWCILDSRSVNLSRHVVVTSRDAIQSARVQTRVDRCCISESRTEAFAPSASTAHGAWGWQSGSCLLSPARSLDIKVRPRLFRSRRLRPFPVPFKLTLSVSLVPPVPRKYGSLGFWR